MIARVNEAEIMEELPKQLRYVTDRIWFYVNDDARCFLLIPKSSNESSLNRFCLNENRDYEDLYQRILLFLKNNIMRWTYGGWDVYFQVAPLVGKPSKEPIQVAKWLPVNLNYKEISQAALNQGCQEGADHSLKCSYQGLKGWTYVNRPPLRRVIEEVKGKIGARPAIVVDSGTGYNLYFHVDGELTLEEFKRALGYITAVLEKRTITYPARPMRLPGTVHPEVGRLAKVIWESDDVLDFTKLLSAARPSQPRTAEKSRQSRGRRKM